MKIDFANTEIELLPEGAVWLPATRVLAVADLHFEKGSFYEASSTFLPPYDTADTLLNLRALVNRMSPATVIAAGDSFHDKNAARRLSSSLLGELNLLVQSVSKWVWLSGNHDPDHNAIIRGTAALELSHGAITFRHQSSLGDGYEISGHYHPKTHLSILGHRVTAKCFAVSKQRLILPSFGLYTGGLDIDDRAFLRMIPRSGRRVFMAHGDRVFAVDDGLADP